MSTMVAITYADGTGETEDVVVRPLRIEYRSTGCPPEPQWVLIAYAVNTGEHRMLAVKNIRKWATPMEHADVVAYSLGVEPNTPEEGLK